MNPRRLLPKLSVSVLAFTAAPLLLQLKCQAFLPQQDQQQSQSQQQQSPPPPANSTAAKPAAPDSSDVGQLPVKRRKVWSNDDVVGLRSAADNYQVEKEQRAAAEAAATAKQAAIRSAAESGKQTAPDIRLPETIEETQKMLKDTEDDIKEETIVLNKLRDELAIATEEHRPDKQKQIDRLTASLEKLRRNSKALQDHLQVLSLKTETENPPPTSY